MWTTLKKKLVGGGGGGGGGGYVVFAKGAMARIRQPYIKSSITFE